MYANKIPTIKDGDFLYVLLFLDVYNSLKKRFIKNIL